MGNGSRGEGDADADVCPLPDVLSCIGYGVGTYIYSAKLGRTDGRTDGWMESSLHILRGLEDRTEQNRTVST
jgi:hypothetical protein